MEVRYLSPAEISATAFIIDDLGNEIERRCAEQQSRLAVNCKLNSGSETSHTIKCKQVRGEHHEYNESKR